MLLTSACLSQIIEGAFVNREQTYGSSVLRCHVTDSGSVGKGQGLDTRSIELNEFVDNAFLSKHLSAQQD